MGAIGIYSDNTYFVKHDDNIDNIINRFTAKNKFEYNILKIKLSRR